MPSEEGTLTEEEDGTGRVGQSICVPLCSLAYTHALYRHGILAGGQLYISLAVCRSLPLLFFPRSRHPSIASGSFRTPCISKN
jgi:hypothetical protein